MINNNCPTKKKHPNYSRRIIILLWTHHRDAQKKRTRGKTRASRPPFPRNRGRNARACIRRRGFRAVRDDRNDQSSASLRLSMIQKHRRKLYSQHFESLNGVELLVFFSPFFVPFGGLFSLEQHTMNGLTHSKLTVFPLYIYINI